MPWKVPEKCSIKDLHSRRNLRHNLNTWATLNHCFPSSTTKSISPRLDKSSIVAYFYALGSLEVDAVNHRCTPTRFERDDVEWLPIFLFPAVFIYVYIPNIQYSCLVRIRHLNLILQRLRSQETPQVARNQLSRTLWSSTGSMRRDYHVRRLPQPA